MTNRSEHWQASAGMLHSYPVLQHFISEHAGSLSGPNSTLADCVSLCASVGIPQRFNSAAVLSTPPGQFLLEESRLLEAAEMAKKAARLDSGEFDVVFSAAHMLR